MGPTVWAVSRQCYLRIWVPWPRSPSTPLVPQSPHLLSPGLRQGPTVISWLVTGRPCVCAQPCPPLHDPMDCSPPGSSVHGILQARVRWVGCHFLLQGIFPTRGSNPRLLHGQVDSLPLSHLGSPTGRLSENKKVPFQKCL